MHQLMEMRVIQEPLLNRKREAELTHDGVKPFTCEVRWKAHLPLNLRPT